MAPEPMLLHGARTGTGDTVLDTVLLVLPLVLFALMVFGPRLLAWYRDLRTEPRETEVSGPARPERPGSHGGEPV
jgi:hypothetical protein